MKQPVLNNLEPSVLQEHQDKHLKIFEATLFFSIPLGFFILWGSLTGVLPVWWPLYVPLLLVLIGGAIFGRSRTLSTRYEFLMLTLLCANGIALNVLRLFGTDGLGAFSENSLYIVAAGIFLFQRTRWVVLTTVLYSGLHLSISASLIGRDPSPERWISLALMTATVGVFFLLYLYRKWWEEAHESRRVYQRLAYTDDLTTLPNRRALINLWQTYKPLESAAVMMVDIDHFKQVNDRFGHAEGDRLLWSVGQLIYRQLGISPRSSAPQPAVGRWGGEEFLVLLPASTPTLAYLFAESIRESVQYTDDATPLTVSLGVALREQGESLAQTAARADTALYQAKQTGRNRVVLYDELDTPLSPVLQLHGSFLPDSEASDQAARILEECPPR
ncbi:GGDEF domain-containing protein [Deinococcus detaillensis]|uniref:GGDEF domain-containing protein n=1 Tax=Deinococcus detaillensis TaxID=2592048 RepID=A0A553V610_9DEIO|nr:GGDEF domain-containing protein [Deinococcus detaillensis]TSA87910.1 GGDEF domain-containing protein [Deinococcus detaillensis]